MSQDFSTIVQNANYRLNQHCIEAGYKTHIQYYNGLHPAERRTVDNCHAYILAIAEATTNPVVDYDGTIAHRTRSGLLVGSQFFHTILQQDEMNVYANRLREDSIWMKNLRVAADIGFLLDRCSPQEHETLLHPSPWLQNNCGDLDPDFMRGVYYTCRLAREAYTTVRLKDLASPDEASDKEQP